MLLTDISLTNFKNIPHADLSLSAKLNCFLGDNGMGKSNLLDAVYYLSFCKSFTGVTDRQLINRESDFAMITGKYRRRDSDETLNVGLRKDHRKTFRRSGKEYSRLSEHIGKFPLVLVAPSDMSLVEGTAEERRRFIDMIISQTDARYLDMLIRYNRALEQRNSLLRGGIGDPILYEAVEKALDTATAYLCATRRQWIDRFSEIFSRYYRDVAGDSEVPTMQYRTHITDESVRLIDLLDRNRQRDMILKHTTAGPHRDDIEFLLSDMPVRRVASQGQAKSYTIALRLAQYEFLRQATDMQPMLLLDDIFDKLDARRVERIMKVVSSDTFGQIFITDTNRKHLDEILTHMGGDYAMWMVADGEFTPLRDNTSAE